MILSSIEGGAIWSALAAALCYTTYILCTRTAVDDMERNNPHVGIPQSSHALHMFLIYGIGFFITYAMIALLACVWHVWTSKDSSTDAPTPLQLSNRAIAILVLTGICGSLGTFFVLMTIWKSNCAAWTSSITLALPVILVSAIGVWLFNERLTSIAWTALAIALVAILLLIGFGSNTS